MTSLALASTPPASAVSRLRDASLPLWWTSLAFLALFAVTALLAAVDPRLFNGISVWIKPSKFFLSLAVHMLTLSFGITLLPERLRQALSTRAIAWTMVSMSVFEMAYITFQAARGRLALQYRHAAHLGALHGHGLGAA